MAGMNAVVLIGNLTRDPELRHTQGGTPVATLGLAVNSREKVNESWQDRADFFDVVVYGNQAEAIVTYLHRGSPVAVSGRLRQDRWNDKDTGGGRSKIVVVARDVQFLQSRDRGGSGSGDEFVPAGSFAVPQGDFTTGDASDFAHDVDDDIPF